MHSFLGDENRILAHAKPLKSSLKVIHFGLFSDGEISRKEKRHSVKKESGETIVLNVPDAYIVSASAAASSEDLGETFTKMLTKTKSTRDKRRRCFLAQRRLKSESGWKAYVDFLPRRMDLVPMFWTEREIERGLKGTVLYEMVKSAEGEIEGRIRNCGEGRVRCKRVAKTERDHANVLVFECFCEFVLGNANDTSPLFLSRNFCGRRLCFGRER